MRYASVRLEQLQRDRAYRIYVTDCLKVIGENTARFAGGSSLTKRYAEVIDPLPVDNRTGEEIAEDIIKRAGIEVI